MQTTRARRAPLQPGVFREQGRREGPLGGGRRVWAAAASRWLRCCRGGGGRPLRGPASGDQVFLDWLLLSHFEVKPGARDAAASRPGWAPLPSVTSDFQFLPPSEL